MCVRACLCFCDDCLFRFCVGGLAILAATYNQVASRPLDLANMRGSIRVRLRFNQDLGWLKDMGANCAVPYSLHSPMLRFVIEL